MRPDMKRVILNTGRSPIWEERHFNEGIRDLEDYASYESNRIKRGYRQSRQRDRLNPLRKYLRAQVGRRWDDVYSEIAAVADRRSLDGHHLLSHVADTIDIPDLIDGYYSPTVYPWRLYNGDMYVDDDGILRLRLDTPRPWWRKKREEDPNKKTTADPHLWYEKRLGLWYKVTIEMREIAVYGGVTVRYRQIPVERKKQLSKKEMKVLGVKNG